MTRDTCADIDVFVAGAGFGGLFALYRLSSRGLTVRGCEAGSDVGGTWYWNRYPGARCDVESLQYSFGFSDELQQDWRWPDKYAVQPDIHAYIRHVADRFDLRRLIDFDTRVVSQVFDEIEGRWAITTDRGHLYRARFCIMATGNLSLPTLPAIDGLDHFEGRWFHSSRWPDKGVSFAGQKVGLIGTGATGVQMVPKLAAEAGHLTVFQRTANFSVPARNETVSDEADAAYKARYGSWRRAAMDTSFGMSGIATPSLSALDVPAEERERIYEERWQKGGSINFLNAFKDLLTNAESNETAATFVRRKIRSTVKDPEVAERLCPKDHPIGSKRLCLDTDYYETFNRPNVTLVDIREDPIVRITKHGIRTQAAEHDLDAIVFATGFDAMTGALLAIDIRGRQGQGLREKWHGGPGNYLGLMTSGFPNLFLITGPGSPSVKSNMVFSIEQHVNWIAECIDYLGTNGFRTIEASAEAEEHWVAHVNAVADATLYTKADSWYLGSNIAGKPRIFMPYVGGVPAYRAKIEAVAREGYTGFILCPQAAAARSMNDFQPAGSS